jgi:hypothetical protein
MNQQTEQLYINANGVDITILWEDNLLYVSLKHLCKCFDIYPITRQIEWIRRFAALKEVDFYKQYNTPKGIREGYVLPEYILPFWFKYSHCFDATDKATQQRIIEELAHHRYCQLTGKRYID